jgi:hypothetical protein
MVAILFAAVVVAAAPFELEVSRGLECPGASAIERALARRVSPAGPGWRVVVDRVEGAGSSLRLRLRQPDGAAVLERVIDLESASCETAADAMALIVERYFRELGWSAPQPRAPAPAAELVAVRPPPAEPARPRVLVFAGPMSWTRGSRPIGVGGELRVRVAGPLHLGAGFLLPGTSTTQTLPGGGQATLSAVPFVLRALAERRWGTWTGLVSLDALLSAERGESSQIARPSSARRFMLAAGGSVGAAWVPAGRLRLAAEVGVARLIGGTDFAVDGYGPVLAPPAWQGLAALRL